MREAAVRMESKHEETSQSKANMCKALQNQHGILLSKRLQTLLETEDSWSDCRHVNSVQSIWVILTLTEEEQVLQHSNTEKLCAEIQEGAKGS